MGRKGGSLKTKRAEGPAFWKIPKKAKRYVIRTSPGPHSKNSSYPLLVLLRDILSLGKTRREIKSVLIAGKIKVDGRVVRAEGFPIGLMDVIEIPDASKTFRVIPYKGGLTAIEVSDKEKDLKLCVVRSKKTNKGAKIGYGLHDGRVIFPEAEVDICPGDACVIKIPSQQFVGSFRLSKSGLALIMKGERSGEVATVEDLKLGTFSRGAIATVRFADGSASELPTTILMPLGKQLPEISISKPGV